MGRLGEIRDDPRAAELVRAERTVRRHQQFCVDGAASQQASGYSPRARANTTRRARATTGQTMEDRSGAATPVHPGQPEHRSVRQEVRTFGDWSTRILPPAP
jgi:hypothetical protein